VLSHIQAAKDAQAARGRAPTRGEKQLVEQAQAVAAEHAGNGAGEGQTTCYMLHSCWTYWGHSGAPLFDERGHVVALHCAWDDRTGIRHAQPLRHLHSLLRRVAHPAAVATGGGRGVASDAASLPEDVGIPAAGKRRKR